MKYKIISTGSRGNALLLDNTILIDCGISFNKLKDYYKNIKLVLLTHIHSDHFNKITIKKLAEERPTLRFGCCKWLVNDLIECGINKKNIDVYEINTKYAYIRKEQKTITIQPILLYHNVNQCGYKVFIDNVKCIYCTDTYTLEGISAPNYDYYFIEANYEEKEIKKRIEAKEVLGIYSYEKDALLNHLSKEKCDEFLINNMGENSRYEYMHQHIEKEVIYE